MFISTSHGTLDCPLVTIGNTGGPLGDPPGQKTTKIYLESSITKEQQIKKKGTEVDLGRGGGQGGGGVVIQGGGGGGGVRGGEGGEGGDGS